ncbi:hypothetical protein Q6306_26370, partial [Klebsiella pneumoniae]|nr:hypothetical protein [Klebsiella pneumoniae]
NHNLLFTPLAVDLFVAIVPQQSPLAKKKHFWVAVIPGVLSILLLGFGLQEPKSAIAHKRSNPLKRENLKKLSAAYWWEVA